MIPATSRPSVIIDIDAALVRVVCAQPGRAGQKMRFERIAIPEHIAADAAAEIGGYIDSQLTARKISAARAVMIVPRSQAVILDMQLPGEIDDDELPSMVRYQSEKELPFAAENAVIDFRRSRISAADSEDGPATAVRVFAVQTQTLDFYRTIAQSAGFKSVAVTLRPVALASYVKAAVDCEADECVIVAFIASGDVEIDFIIDGEAVFSRSARLADGSASQRSQKVCREIKLSMQGFAAAFGERETGGVLLGGDPQISAVACAELEEQLDCDCMLFKTDIPPEAESLDQSWVAALGAGLSSCGPEHPMVDLLNPRRAVDHDAIKRRQGTLAIVTVFIALVFGMWLGFSHLSGLRGEAKRLGSLRNSREDDAKKVQLLRKRVNAIGDWPDDQVDWLTNLSNISQLAPGADKLYIAEVKTDKSGQLSLPVRSTDAESIQAFAAALAAQSGYSVTLPTIAPPGIDKLNLGYVYANTIEVTVDPGFEPAIAETPPGRPVDDDSDNELPRRFGRNDNRRGGR